MPASPSVAPRLLLLACALLAALVCAAILRVNADVLTRPCLATSDTAANGLLVLQAKQGRLSTGNYSRLNFHHPGPALFYALAAGEWIAYDLTGWTASPVGGQAAAAAVGNALWAALALWLLARLFGALAPAAVMATVGLALLAAFDAQALVSLWFPYLYVLPFAVFLLASARLAQGRLDALLALVLATGVLVHGHAAFAPICGFVLLGAGVAGALALARRAHADAETLWSALAAALREHRVQLGGSVALALLFAWPTVQNAGEIAQYSSYGRAVRPHGWLDSARFVLWYWGASHLAWAAAVAALLGAPVLLLWRHPARSAALALAWVIGLSSVATLLYARNGIDDLEHRYTILYSLAPVAWAWGLLAAALLLALPARARPVVAVAIVAAAAVLLPLRLEPWQKDCSDDVARLLALLPASAGAPVVLDLDNRGAWQPVWTLAVGAVLQAERQGGPALCIGEGWHLLFTRALRCDEVQPPRGPHVRLELATAAPSPGRSVTLGEVRVRLPD